MANLNTGDTAFILLSAALVEGGEHYRHSEDEAKARAREAKWQRSDAAYETHQRATIAKILASHARDSIFRVTRCLWRWSSPFLRLSTRRERR